VTIRQYRIKLGWSIAQLAEASGLTAQTVSRIERGAPARDFNVGKIAKALSDALGQEITIDDLEGVKLFQ
jgi:transcriptional regulator with XRE-family HTH domain